MDSPNVITLTFKIHPDEDPPDEGGGVQREDLAAPGVLNDLKDQEVNVTRHSQPQDTKGNKLNKDTATQAVFGSKYASSATQSFGSICKSAPVIFGTTGSSILPFDFSLFTLRDDTTSTGEVQDSTAFSSRASASSGDDSDTESHTEFAVKDVDSDIEEIESRVPSNLRMKIALNTGRRALPLSPWKKVSGEISGGIKGIKGKLSITKVSTPTLQVETAKENNIDLVSEPVEHPSLDVLDPPQVLNGRTKKHENWRQRRYRTPEARGLDQSDSENEEESGGKEESSKTNDGSAAALIQQKVIATRDAMEGALHKEVQASDSLQASDTKSKKKSKKRKKKKSTKKSSSLDITWETKPEASSNQDDKQVAQLHAPLLGYHGPNADTDDYPPLTATKIQVPSTEPEEKSTNQRTVSYASAAREGRDSLSTLTTVDQVDTAASMTKITVVSTEDQTTTHLTKQNTSKKKSSIVLKARSEPKVPEVSKQEAAIKKAAINAAAPLPKPPDTRDETTSKKKHEETTGKKKNKERTGKKNHKASKKITSKLAPEPPLVGLEDTDEPGYEDPSKNEELSSEELSWLLHARMIDDEKFRHNVLLREVMALITNVFRTYLNGTDEKDGYNSVSMINLRSGWILDFLNRPPKHSICVPIKNFPSRPPPTTILPKSTCGMVYNAPHPKDLPKKPLPGNKRESASISFPPSKKPKMTISVTAPPFSAPTTGPKEYLHKTFSAMSSSNPIPTTTLNIPVFARSASSYLPIQNSESLRSLAPLSSLMARRNTINDSIHLYSITDVISTLQFARAIQKSGDFLPQLPPSLSAKIARAKYDDIIAPALLRPIQSPVRFVLMQSSELYVLEKCLCWIFNVNDISHVDLKHFENNKTDGFNCHVQHIVQEVGAIVRREREVQAYQYYTGRQL